VSAATKTLKKRLIGAITALPYGDTGEAKREAAVSWRHRFIETMFDRKPDLWKHEDYYLSHFASGAAIDFRRIEPVVTACRTREDFDIYDYFRMLSSFPTGDRPGRRLKFLIRDFGHAEHPLMGLCCISSVVRQLRVRDEWIGWHGPGSLGVRALGLAHIMDVSTCIGVPPYSYLTAGKLLAALMASNEIREAYRVRYERQKSIARKRILTELVLLTTSGAYGRNAPQYKGLNYNGEPLYQFLGYSTGYSTFQIPPKVYELAKALVLSSRNGTDARMTGGANAKLRMLRFAARELGIPEEALVFSGYRRAIFAAPLARNWREFLLGKDTSSDYYDYTSECAISRWRAGWLAKRLRDSTVVAKVRDFSPESVRITRQLKLLNG